eukprot:scaffold3987_cov134-Cylindrotheca_fusiformis.AAC.19
MRYNHHQITILVIACLEAFTSGLQSHSASSFRPHSPISKTTSDFKTSYHQSCRRTSGVASLSASASFAKVLSAPTIYGITADGEPCKNCMKQGRYCWHHRWQQKTTKSISENEESNYERQPNTSGFRESIISFAMVCIALDVMKLRILLKTIHSIGAAIHQSNLSSSMISMALSQFNMFAAIQVRTLLDSLSTLSITRLGGLTLGSPLILGLIFGRYLCSSRGLKTTELLQSVQNSVRQVRYVCETSSLYGSSRNSQYIAVPSGAKRDTQVASKNPSAYKPWSQLMAKTYASGEDVGIEPSNTSSASFSSGRKKRILRSVLSITAILAVVGIANKDATLRLIQAWKQNYSSAKIRDKMVPILDQANAAGLKGQLAYTFCLLLWTMTVGVTTPVETAAGIAFGFERGVICNAVGKIGGAVLSFIVGRSLLYDYVNEKFGNNELLGLVEESIQEHPLRVKMGWFVAAVLMHGLPFSVLWTSLGVQTAAIMRGADPSRGLKILMTGVSWLGVISPTIIGFWIKGLREKKRRRQQMPLAHEGDVEK